MDDRMKGRRRLQLALALSLLVLAIGGRASRLAADDDCTRTRRDGTERDCTFIEEVRECMDDALESWEDCMEDAMERGLIERQFARIGCESGWLFNGIACHVSTTSDWALGK